METRKRQIQAQWPFIKQCILLFYIFLLGQLIAGDFLFLTVALNAQ